MGSEPHRNCSQSWAECMCHLSLPIGFVLVRTGRGIWGILIMIFGPITTTSPKGIIIEQLFYVSEPFSSSMKVKVKSLSRARLFATPWTVAYQAPPSMGFSRQEYWSGLPFPSPGYLPNPGIEPRSPTFQVDALTSEPPGKPKNNVWDLSKSLSFSSYLSPSHIFGRKKSVWYSEPYWDGVVFLVFPY